MTDKPRRPRALLYDEPVPAEQYTNVVVAAGLRRGDNELSKLESEFCSRFTTHYIAIRAFMDTFTACPEAKAPKAVRRLLDDPRIAKRIAEIEADRLRRMRFDGDTFLAQEIIRATTPMTELMEVWVPPCRYCWGRNYEYQRTHAEFQEAWEAWLRLPVVKNRRQVPTYDFGYGEVLAYDDGCRKIPFDQKGGDGYDVSEPPNPACPNCRGRGLEIPGHGSLGHIKLKDTRELSLAGKLLFAGAEHNTRGLKVLAANQDAARLRLSNMISRFLELRAAGQTLPGSSQPGIGFGMGVVPSVASLLTDDVKSMSDTQLDLLLSSYGVTDADVDGQDGEGTASRVSAGEAPPPGRIA